MLVNVNPIMAAIVEVTDTLNNFTGRLHQPG